MALANGKGRAWRAGDVGAAALLLALTACSSPESPVAPRDPAELSAAPTTTAIGGRTLSLETYLWRDFQPSSPPNGKPLVVVARIRSTDGSPIPATVVVTGLWVVNAGEVWTASPREETRRAPNGSMFEVVAREGPKWGPGISVDVVVGLRDGNGEVSLLRAPAQRINRTD